MSHRKIFDRVALNTGIASVTNFFVRFALTFWAYLTTQSVVVTSLIAGSFALLNTLSAVIFGTIVDHHKKKYVMIRSSVASLACYLLATLIYTLSPAEAFTQVWSRRLWLLIVVLMLGVIIGNLRMISLSTLVTLLIPTEEHAKANGKIGIINGIGFGVTSVISGLIIGYSGMGGALLVAIGGSILVLLHLIPIHIAQDTITHLTDAEKANKFDFKSTIRVVQSIPGMFALIFFTTFNNFLGGAFMALMDPYGLSLMSVKAWGIMLGILSLGFVLGGFLITKFGLGKNPLQTMFRINILTWFTCIFFVIQPSIALLAIGMLIWMTCGPFVESAESTVIQKVVPYTHQGRVFGFAQSIESAATPITAFLIGPITQYFFIPFMSTGKGAQWIGSRFGIGSARGIALVFICAGILGLIVTLIAYHSKYYKLLSATYTDQQSQDA